MIGSNWLEVLMSVVVGFIHLTTLSLLFGLSIRVVRNVIFLRRVERASLRQEDMPFVSVLIPARNEGKTIRQCVESLVAQDYPNYEIVVLDDQSDDDTLVQLEALAIRHPIRIIRGTEHPPAGWNGKNYACLRLAKEARGDWLLFTDADTVHSPASIRRGVQQASHLRVDLLSAMPFQKTGGWSEHLMIPFIMEFLPLIGVDFQMMWRGKGRDAIANGQYMLMRREAYDATGRHQAIARQLVDDFALASHFRHHGWRIAFVAGSRMLSCRMYDNARDVWRGFSKNILLSLQTTRAWSLGASLGFAWGFICLFVLPFFLFLTQITLALSILEIVWLFSLRWLVGWVTRRPVWESFLTVFSALGVMILGLNALISKARNRRIVWKGRAYPIYD